MTSLETPKWFVLQKKMVWYSMLQMLDLQWVLESMEDFFFKELEDIIFSYKTMNLPFSVFLSLLQTLPPLLKKYAAPSKEPEKEQFIMKSRSASRGIYENITYKDLLLLLSFVFRIPKSIEMEIVCEERRMELFWLKTKIPAEQLQYCNYNNLHFSDV